MSTTSWKTAWMLMILLAALGVRSAAAVKWQRDTQATGRTLRLGDSDSYWVLAGHFARGQPYQYGSVDASIFRAPLYPMVLAPFTLISQPAQGILAARLLGCICGTLSVWLIMQLAWRLTVAPSSPASTQLASTSSASMPSASGPFWCRPSALPVAALAAGGLAAFYPGGVGMSIVILSESIFCPLLLLCLLHWHSALRSDQLVGVRFHALLAGGLAGLAILARPSLLLFMPFASLVILAFHPRRRHQLMVTALMALGTSAVMSPWWIRNASITARFVPTTLQVGASLYDGLHAGASGGSDEDMQFVQTFIDQQREADEELRQAAANGKIDVVRHSSFEYRLNARIQNAAWDWTAKNLSGAFRLSLLKFAKTWSLWPAAGEVGSTGLRLMLTLGCFSVLSLAAWASLAGIKARAVVSLDGWLLVLCWLPALYFTLLHMLFVGSIRYREPAVLVLTAVAGVAIQQITTIQQHRHGSQSIERRADRQN